MKLIVNNNKSDEIKEEHIVNLTNIIEENINILKLISSIENMSVKEISYEEVIRDILEQAILSGWITDLNEGQNVINIFSKLTNEKKGILLENIIFKLGPINQDLYSVGRLREVTVKQTDMDNNFDVVFYSNCTEFEGIGNYNLKIFGNIEFHECKKNVANFIPYNPRKRIDRSVENKLKYFKKVYDIKPDAEFYIPTFTYDVDAQVSFLEEFENSMYSFIEILTVNDIIYSLS